MLKLVTPLLFALASAAFAQLDAPVIAWRANDRTRPQPPQVQVFPPFSDAQPVAAPSGAIMLFDGRDIEQWQRLDGAPAHVRVHEGYLEVVPGPGSIHSRRRFANCQVHVEWQIPAEVKGTDHARGNSGAKLMDHYEIQVFDSFRNPTYADGAAGSVYSEYPPLVNPSLSPGRWQSYRAQWANRC